MLLIEMQSFFMVFPKSKLVKEKKHKNINLKKYNNIFHTSTYCNYWNC